ncbi:MAG TPA: serine/threonine-protein kinase [Gemmatimonadaceae bacterium]|nr:serine/threonine-protein kinase [Gemmatimonadaceae bacterium]
MFCPNCGTAVPNGAAFCANCGASVGAGQSAVATVAKDLTPDIPPISLTPGEPGATGGDALLQMVKDQLGRDYRIDKELGRGGMAVVYKGVEIALERTVALKVVPPDSANVGQAAERFRREAKLAASLDHPNIIPVYRVGQAGPLHYMAMKFVEGRAADAIIEQQGALPLSICVAILKAAAAGLAFAHERKIVHRDIKPANILIDKDGRCMVSDFGIARALEEVSMTASGMMIGTPYYMSPEQCGGQKVSPQSDQYSLGIMGFQMLTGEVPFLADSMVGVIQHHYMTPVPDILQVRAEVPKELLDIIYCALNKDPADRFPTTREMAQALENVPLSDTEREEADALLKDLSAGRVIPKVRTGTLPPLNLTISGPGPRVQPRPITSPKTRPPQAAIAPRRKKKKNKLMLPAMGLIFAGLGSGIFLQYQNMQADQKRIADSTRVADSLAQERELALTRGSRVIAGLPENVRVAINGRLYANGETFTADTATYSATATAPGYEPLQSAVVIEAGKTDTVYLQMKPLVTSSAAQSSQRQQQFLPIAPRDSSEVRLGVTPPYADILIDGTKIGSGRAVRKLTVGPHTVRYTAPNCDAEDRSITVNKGELLIVPNLSLNCH